MVRSPHCPRAAQFRKAIFLAISHYGQAQYTQSAAFRLLRELPWARHCSLRLLQPLLALPAGLAEGVALPAGQSRSDWGNPEAGRTWSLLLRSVCNGAETLVMDRKASSTAVNSALRRAGAGAGELPQLHTYDPKLLGMVPSSCQGLGRACGNAILTGAKFGLGKVLEVYQWKQVHFSAKGCS